ncbi:hypothetical protein KY285_011249 [Solanum tuberosum]|nr:hypothetical protein KY285_011249 [Solanum tuberosum]
MEDVKPMRTPSAGSLMYAMVLQSGYKVLVDSYMVGNVDGKKSTTGYVLTLGSATISWTTEAKYVAATETCKEMIWLIKELGQDQGWNAGCIVTTKCHSFGEELYISFKDEAH